MREENVICTVTDGNASNLKKVKDTICSFEGEVEVLIRKKKKYRSGLQNNYIHKLFRIFAAELIEKNKSPYPPEVVVNEDLIKAVCKKKFATRQIVDVSTGEVLDEYIQDTSGMTTGEMSVFVEQVIAYAADRYHLQLPFPGESISLDLREE